MNCAFDKEKLSGYYDGELAAAEKADVERHIASCSECLRDLGELKSAALLVKELPRLRAPRAIAEGVSREIAASGKVHVFAKFRRNLMWVAAAAAGVFVMINVMYLAKRESSPVASLARAPQPTAAPLAEVPVARDQAPPKPGADRNAAEQLREKAAFDERQSETRKNRVEEAEKKAAPKLEDARRSLDMTEANRERGAKELAKAADPKPAEAPVPPAARPLPAPVTASPAPTAAAKEEPKAPAAPVAKPEALGKREAEGVVQKDAEQMKLKQATLDGKVKDGAADAGPTHLTLACTQVAKTRPQLEDALGKMGCSLPSPPAPMKGIKSMAREPDPTITVELTESQIAKLQKDFEKQGEAKLVVGAPEDPLVLSWLRGGSLAFGRKDGASGGAGAPARKKPESKEDSKEKDAVEEAPAVKAPAEAPADKAGEPRRKVIFHVVEMKVRPPDPPPK